MNSKVLKRGYNNNNTKKLQAATPQNVKKFWKFEHIQKDLFFQAATRYELQTVWILLIVSQVLFNKLEPTVYNVDKTSNNISNNNNAMLPRNYKGLIEATQWGIIKGLYW